MLAHICNKGVLIVPGENLQLKNYTVDNKATSVGTQLINNYKRFLLDYEKEHAERDLPPIQQPQVGLASHLTICEIHAQAKIASMDLCTHVLLCKSSSDTSK